MNSTLGSVVPLAMFHKALVLMSFIEEKLIDPRALCTFTSGVLLLAPIILVFGAIATATRLLPIILVFSAIATATATGLLPIILVFSAGLRPG